MMKILGILDIFVAIILLSVSLNADIPKQVVVAVAALLCLKGFIFILDPASVIDVGIGILLLVSLFIALPFLVLLIPAGFLALKGTLSLAA